MFDSELVSADEATVVAAIEEWAATEARAAARRLAAIGELVRRRCSEDERAHWACDSWDAAAAEVSAALGISQGRASGEMHLSQALLHRLPHVAELFMAGRLNYRVCRAIAWRTDLVCDGDALALIDAAVAEAAVKWGPLSDYRLEQAIDVWIDRFDPGALRRTRATARSRNLNVGSRDDGDGTTSIWGRLYATDAAALDRKLTQMAHGVCEDDPRTIASGAPMPSARWRPDRTGWPAGVDPRAAPRPTTTGGAPAWSSTCLPRRTPSRPSRIPPCPRRRSFVRSQGI